MFPIYLPFVSVWKNIEGTLSTDEGFLLKVSLITIQRKLLPRLSLKQPERLTSKPSRKIEKLFLREEKPENGFNYGKKNFPRTRKKKKLANNPMDDGREKSQQDDSELDKTFFATKST